MSDEDKAEFNRQTTWAGRTIAMKRPGILVAVGVVFAAAFAVAAPFVEPASGGIALALTGLVTGGFLVGLSLWSFRHREEARRTVELRNRYTARFMRKPKKWMLLIPPAAGLVAAGRAAGDGLPWYALVGVGVGVALLVAAIFGIQIWRARTGRMDDAERRSNPQVNVG